MCTAGIGWSMLKIRGMWNLFEHDDKIPQEFRYNGKKYNLCLDCLDRAKKSKNPKRMLEPIRRRKKSN